MVRHDQFDENKPLRQRRTTAAEPPIAGCESVGIFELQME